MYVNTLRRQLKLTLFSKTISGSVFRTSGISSCAATCAGISAEWTWSMLVSARGGAVVFRVKR